MSDAGPEGFVRGRGEEPRRDAARPPVFGGLLLSRANAPGIENCLGAITMTPGVVGTEAVQHETGEVMYVAAGRGELRTDDGAIPFSKGDAIFIPAGAWHWLANTGEDDLVSVFSFPGPDRPAGRSRPVTD